MFKSRRQFLKQSALCVAGAAGAALLSKNGVRAEDPAGAPAAGVPGALAFARKLSPRLKLSCAAYSYRKYLEKGPMDLDGFLERCAGMGLEAAELTSYYFPRTDPEYLNHLKRKAFLLGLDISGTAVGNDFCRPPGPERDKDLALVKTWVENAARLGAPSIRIFAGSVKKGQTEEEARKLAVEGMRESCEHAARHGVLLALENHGGITSTAEGVLSLLRAVDSPWLGLNLDTGNFHTDDPYRDLELSAPHAVTVQLKVEVAPRGKPKVEADLPRVLGMLRKVNYRGYVALEYEADEDPMTAVPRYIEKLKGLISQADLAGSGH